MSAVVLSSRQREILEAMADGARLFDGWSGGPPFLHDGDAVDGRSVYRLIRRELVAWRAPRPVGELVLTDAGWWAVRPDGGES